MNAIREYLPPRQEILYAFGGVVFLVYNWSIRGFFYQLSSLRLYHTLGEIFGVFCYLMAFALVESLVVMGSLILACLVLPGNWLKEGFAYKGFLTILVTGTAMVLLNNYLFSLSHETPPTPVLYIGTGITLACLISLIWISQNKPKIQGLLLAVQERMQVFIYFYVPLGIAGSVVVVLRIIL